ncbi:MAG: glycosyl transferase family 39 [Alphaproteobacteria bacterium CG11_big_fil_rev_8_21_14_0_20_39_49]|nr:MAG: glycosyl transferase family 39 [Alphaproteobacteria bacterium CG11_big_fil_rev_8_21_14_0_20_39_49]
MTREIKIFFILTAAITAYRIYYLSLEEFNLFFDEAQYWYWSQTFDWGYYSKPPMVAWLISLTTSICGDTEGCVRLASPLLHFITSVTIYCIARELYKDEKTAMFSGLAYATLPAVSVSSALISTDSPLLTFYALSLLFFIKAVRQNSYKHWITAGIMAGLGMMSKYNMLLFLLSAMLYMFLSPDNRKHLKGKGFWTACVIAGLIFLPNVIWNFNNGLVSFLHTKDNAQGGGFSLHFDNMFEFLGSQLGVFGPIFFGTLLFILFKVIKNCKADDATKLLLCFILPLLLVITAVSLLSRAHANWAAPIYVPATVLVCAYLLQNNRKKLIIASFAIHVFAAALLTNFYKLGNIPNVEISGRKTKIEDGKLFIKDPFKRVHGWEELGQGVIVLLDSYPSATVLTDSRKIHSELLYYARPRAYDAVKWNPTGNRGDHFEVTTDITDATTKDFLYITANDSADKMNNYFESIERVGNVHIPLYNDFDIDFYFYYLKGFKGYDAVNNEMSP